MREALKPDGWFVVCCPGGGTADILLKSRIKYNLLLFDNELQDVAGWRWWGWRSLEHRAGTPVILLSLKACAVEGLCAGVDKVVRKPEQLHELPEMIRQRLATKKSEAQSRAASVGL